MMCIKFKCIYILVGIIKHGAPCLRSLRCQFKTETESRTTFYCIFVALVLSSFGSLRVLFFAAVGSRFAMLNVVFAFSTFCLLTFLLCLFVFIFNVFSLREGYILLEIQMMGDININKDNNINNLSYYYICLRKII